MIMDLENRSGAKIGIDHGAKSHLFITYKATTKAIASAKAMVEILSGEGKTEDDLPLGEAKQEIVNIPSQWTSTVNEVVLEMQKRAKARIKVADSSMGIFHETTQVEITGTSLGITEAKATILYMVNSPDKDAMEILNLLLPEEAGPAHPFGGRAVIPRRRSL